MQRVLLIRIGRLGDTVLATAVIGPLQEAFGDDVLIDFVSSPGASAAILNMDERINRVFAVAHRRVHWRVHAVKREIEKCSRETPYDLVINLECGDECDDFVRFVHYKVFCGRPRINPQHQSDRHCVDTEKTIYAELLGFEATHNAVPSLRLKPDLQPLPVSAEAGYVVINPGFSGLNRPGYRSHRGWPQAHWKTLIELIGQKMSAPILINGTTEEENHFSALLKLPGVHSLFGSSLATLAAALTGARCLVTVDTGTMHLAAALGTPVVALFGPGNALLTGPYCKDASHRILSTGLECQPCVKTAQQKKCTDNRCMLELLPKQVFAACQPILQR